MVQSRAATRATERAYEAQPRVKARRAAAAKIRNQNPEHKADCARRYLVWVKTPAGAAKRRAYEQSRKGALSIMVKAAGQRAKRLDREFSITPADIEWPEICPVTGEKMIPGTAFTPSLDRRDNSLGYVAGNVFVISKHANNRKGDMTVEYLRKLLKYMEGKA